ncbi:MAG TPA: hypothetical protein VFF04_05635 [Candidatus Babeliales bacterium]|nr:hypothetical protein [Candidatus Babeliales bacterium]
MLMFLTDSAFSLELLAIAAGVALILWSLRNQGAGVGLASFFGYVVLILAIFALLCTTYYAFGYWIEGYYRSPIGNLMQVEHKIMMKNNGTTSGMMSNQTGNQNQGTPEAAQQ